MNRFQSNQVRQLKTEKWNFPETPFKFCFDINVWDCFPIAKYVPETSVSRFELSLFKKVKNDVELMLTIKSRCRLYFVGDIKESFYWSILCEIDRWYINVRVSVVSPIQAIQFSRSVSFQQRISDARRIQFYSICAVARSCSYLWCNPVG